MGDVQFAIVFLDGDGRRIEVRNGVQEGFTALHRVVIGLTCLCLIIFGAERKGDGTARQVEPLRPVARLIGVDVELTGA